MASSVLNDMKKQDAEPDMTPMIDVTFLLLIFFMVVSEMAKVEYESLTLPMATTADEDRNEKEKRVVINITYVPPTGGRTRVVSDIKIRSKAYNEQQELIQFLLGEAALAGKSGDGMSSTLQVKIRADGRAEYQRVQQVMVACMKAAISKISIGAAPKDF